MEDKLALALSEGLIGGMMKVGGKTMRPEPLEMLKPLYEDKRRESIYEQLMAGPRRQQLPPVVTVPKPTLGQLMTPPGRSFQDERTIKKAPKPMDGRMIRAQQVKALMAKYGFSLPQASSYLKQNGPE
jgi:hypothetical protein